MCKWIEVSTKPNEFIEVLLFDKTRNKKELGYYVQELDVFMKTNERKGNFFKATHWLDIPDITD